MADVAKLVSLVHEARAGIVANALPGDVGGHVLRRTFRTVADDPRILEQLLELADCDFVYDSGFANVGDFMERATFTDVFHLLLRMESIARLRAAG